LCRSVAHQEGGKTDLFARIEEVIDPRNDQAHSFARPSGFYEHLEPALLEVLDDLLVAVQPLGRYRLVSLERIDDVDMTKQAVRCRVLSLQGPSETFPLVERVFPSQPQRTWCSLLAEHPDQDVGDATLLCLSPLVRVEYCPECRRTEVFIAKGLPHPTREAIGTFDSLFTGHKREVALEPWQFCPAE